MGIRRQQAGDEQSVLECIDGRAILRALRCVRHLGVVCHVEHAPSPVAHMCQHHHSHISADAGADVDVILRQHQLMAAAELPDDALQDVQICRKVCLLCSRQVNV